MRGISLLAENRLASQEGLCSMESDCEGATSYLAPFLFPLVYFLPDEGQTNDRNTQPERTEVAVLCLCAAVSD